MVGCAGARERETGTCSTGEGTCNPTGDAGIDDAGVDAGEDAGTCELPAAQPAGAPCCPDLGVDACTLGAFCEAFDGRTQAICYRERSRQDGETCVEDIHCASGDCRDGVCARVLQIGDPCTGPDQCPAPVICDPEVQRCLSNTNYACNPVTLEGCPAPNGCIFVAQGSTVCTEVGGVEESGACHLATDCARGLFCAAEGCVPFCMVEDATTCPDGTCYALPKANGDPAPYGVCI